MLCIVPGNNPRSLSSSTARFGLRVSVGATRADKGGNVCLFPSLASLGQRTRIPGSPHWVVPHRETPMRLSKQGSMVPQLNQAGGYISTSSNTGDAMVYKSYEW